MDNIKKKSILVQMSGGIGNQLFQLANAWQLCNKYNRTLIISDKNSHPRNTYWDSILVHFKPFVIPHHQFSMLKSKSNAWNWAMTRFEYKEIILNEDIFSYSIEGYYQSYKYFDIQLFRNMIYLNSFQNKYSCNDNDVAVHIRRTDYAQNNFHRLLPIQYYYNALLSLQKKININHIFIFSDDLNWCKNNFSYNKDFTFVELNNDLQEIQFMSSFNNIIIANSTFSWWSAYLSKAQNIYCPKNWFNPNCSLNTVDLRPSYWNIINDEIPYSSSDLNKKFDKNIFNVISLGCACCTVQNIHDNIYNNLGPLYRQPDNATNFLDWVICDFRTIVYLFENLKFKDSDFLNIDNFTTSNVKASPNQLHGGWMNVYRKVENKDYSMIFLHDVQISIGGIPQSFFEKYKRRFDRMYNKITENNSIHFIHTFDFQWLSPYFPNTDEIQSFFESCKTINPICDVHLYFLIHPNFNTDKNKPIFNSYLSFPNLHLYYLKDKGWKDDWKANNLTFDQFFSAI